MTTTTSTASTCRTAQRLSRTYNVSNTGSMGSESRSRDAQHARNDRPIPVCRNGMCPYPRHHIASRDPCNRTPNSPASSQDPLAPSKRHQTITTKLCGATSISSNSFKSASPSQTRRVTFLKTSRHGSSISSLASGALRHGSQSACVQHEMSPAFFFLLARTCTRQSPSNCCKSRDSIFRDTRRWASCQTTLQSSLSPLVSSLFQKQGGYRSTGEVLAARPFFLRFRR